MWSNKATNWITIPLIVSGIIYCSYYLIIYVNQYKAWSISISGNQQVPTKEIKTIILKQIQNTNSHLKKNIKQILELDSRIQKVSCSIFRLFKSIKIEIKEEEVAYYIHEKFNGSNYYEYSAHHHIINENIVTKKNKIFLNLLILYLTDRVKYLEGLQALKRDIIMLYQKTLLTDKNIWNNISEIQIDSLDKLNLVYHIYSNEYPIKITSKERFDSSTLQKVASIFSFFKSRKTNMNIHQDIKNIKKGLGEEKIHIYLDHEYAYIKNDI